MKEPYGLKESNSYTSLSDKISKDHWHVFLVKCFKNNSGVWMVEYITDNGYGFYKTMKAHKFRDRYKKDYWKMQEY